MLVVTKHPWRHLLSARCHCCKGVGCLVEASGDVLEFKAMKLAMLSLWQLHSFMT